MVEPLESHSKNISTNDSENCKTVYQHDFTRKTGKKEKLFSFESDYKDILAGPYENLVLPEKHYNDLKNKSMYENIHNYRNKIAEERPKYKRYLDPEINDNFVKTEIMNNKKTVYQVDFCKFENGLTSEREKEVKVELPEDWSSIPETTQKSSFRNFSKIIKWNFKSKAFLPPKSALDPNKEKREMLKVTTGESEYQETIGTMGKEILEFSYHGKIPQLPGEININ